MILLLASCRQQDSSLPEKSAPLFTSLSPEQTNIRFANTLTEGLNNNVLMYEYFYNGGGVAVADLNGDHLQDVYFSGNMVDNALYLNEGSLRFRDITMAAGVAGRPGPWKTGVTIADVNGDGKPDIFLCYSGKLRGTKRIPQLFINQGNDNQGVPIFKDEAAAFGLTDSAFSTQGYFFDYDLDGDLDLLLLNHNPKRISNITDAAIRSMISTKDKQTGTRLFRNDHNHFTDVTAGSGIVNSMLSYNLAAGISDLNQDGWPDIYVSNDYLVPDYLYINNKNGTFSDRLDSSLNHTSQFSMGNDIADVNNDGLPDIYSLDMLPEDNHRQKMLAAPDNYELFDMNMRTGFHAQFMRNMLQLNNGDGSFSEVGQLMGISNTDWSWSPLFADYDNDGWKDLFVTNGYLRDYTNMDFLMYIGNEMKKSAGTTRQQLLSILEKMPSSSISSYFFHNQQGSDFKNTSKDWGIDSTSNSNGAAYADLDNDGDLDLIVNNINQPAFIYRNNANVKNANFVAIQLTGSGGNTAGIGAKVQLYISGQTQYAEQMPNRGYQSSVSPIIHFGLGRHNVVDSIRVIWPGGESQLLTSVKSNQVLQIKQADARSIPEKQKKNTPVFQELPSKIAYSHSQAKLNDFYRQSQLVNPMSFNGPVLIKGDVNGDGLQDVYAGAGNGQIGKIFIQQRNGSFLLLKQPAFYADTACEDGAALFADLNHDGYVDLYIGSGGYHQYKADDPLLQDRLYLNDGKGKFTRAPQDALPPMHVSKSCVKSSDINNDGFPDLFVGGRVVPGRYPESPESFLLINDGKGHFTDKISSLAPELLRAGMITDAAWVDLDEDGKQDLVVTGEWMPIEVFVNDNGRLTNKTKSFFSEDNSGWWNTLTVTDVNHDGIADLVAGNLGLNTQCQASPAEPVQMYYGDFDQNGLIDPILTTFIQHKSFPFLSKDELTFQISGMARKYRNYKDYADATIDQVLTKDQLSMAKKWSATELRTCLFLGQRKGTFKKIVLPETAQYAPVFSILPLDYDHDGKQDLLLCGNINHARLRFGNEDANYGQLLQGDGSGNFTAISQAISGFHIRGDVRQVIGINDELYIGINGGKTLCYGNRLPVQKQSSKEN